MMTRLSEESQVRQLLAEELEQVRQVGSQAEHNRVLLSK